MDSSNTYADSSRTARSDTQRSSRSRSQNVDSARSGYLKNRDSGFLTNSSESRDMSPRQEIIRKTRSRSPSMGRYVLDDRYKNAVSLRHHTILTTFEDMELEKMLLKDENRDMKDVVSQMQSTIRQLETGRIRDAERFDLQEREVDALRMQLKTEKEGRQSSASLVEELQSDLTRKSDLLAISNEELIETRERLRVLDKQLHDEGNNRTHVERSIRDYRDKLEDYSTELEVEKKVSRTSLETIRDLKDEVAKLQHDLRKTDEAVKDLVSACDQPITVSGLRKLQLHNAETEQNLQRILTNRNELSKRLTDSEKENTSHTAHSSRVADHVQALSRVLKAGSKDEIGENTVLHDGVFRDQLAAVNNLPSFPAFNPLLAAVVKHIEQEIKKRKASREAVEGLLRKYNWKGIVLSDTQLIPLLNAILHGWSSQREHNARIVAKLTSLRKNLHSANQVAITTQVSTRNTLSTFRNTVLTPQRHRLEEDFYKFADITKTRHEAVRRYLEAAHFAHLANEISKIRADLEAAKAEAVALEKQRTEQVENRLTAAETVVKSKDKEIEKMEETLRDAESKLYRKIEEFKQAQREHATNLDSAGKQHSLAQLRLQQQMDELETNLKADIAKHKKDLDQRAKTIALLDEGIVTKDQRISQLQGRIKEQENKLDDVRKQLELEKDPNKNQKLYIALKGYEREIADLKNKVVERDNTVSHLKRRVDEALNRGQKKLNESTERNRTELTAKDLKIIEKEKEVEKLQEQLTRLSRVAAKSPGQKTEPTRATVLSAVPIAKNVVGVRGVTATTEASRLPPIVPAAGIVGPDPINNGMQTSRRTTARSETRPRTQSISVGI